MHTEKSLKLTQDISNLIDNKTFHHHYHILFDIANTYEKNIKINYLEIGCYAGGSACLMLQRPNTNVISIDLGKPISKTIVENNVKKLNKYNNNFNYIKGDSKDKKTLASFLNIIDNIDILFIDGDHSYNGVIEDFKTYSQFVNPKGYIIFDDYNDSKYSPKVKIAVDDIVKKIESEYEIIGTLKNIYSARPIEITDGNCFIIRKK
jgi:predicted O-methyltransferase YrrM